MPYAVLMALVWIICGLSDDEGLVHCISMEPESMEKKSNRLWNHGIYDLAVGCLNRSREVLVAF